MRTRTDYTLISRVLPYERDYIRKSVRVLKITMVDIKYR